MKNKKIKEQINENLKIARKNKGYTQEQMSKIIFNSNQSLYGRYERGENEFNYEQIIKICQVLEIEPNEIFEGCI